MQPQRIEPGPGQESVWDYPRPPRLEDTAKHIRIVFAGVVIAETRRPKRVLETSHPPVYYIPPDDIQMQYLARSDRHSFCEWKGQARYYHVVVGDRTASNAAWYYSKPESGYEGIKNHVAFYAQLMDVCTVDGEVVQPQPGKFYGGWITRDIVGPFKGGSESWGW